MQSGITHMRYAPRIYAFQDSCSCEIYYISINLVDMWDILYIASIYIICSSPYFLLLENRISLGVSNFLEGRNPIPKDRVVWNL